MTTRSKKVLLTTALFFSFVDRQHPKHAQSEAFFRYFAQEQFHLFAGSFSVNETYNQLRRLISYSIAKDFIKNIYLGSIDILYPDELTTRAALKLVLTQTGADLTLDQALINVLADRAQISQICSYEYSSYYFGIEPFSLPY